MTQLWVWWADKYPVEIDLILYLLICLPALFWYRNRRPQMFSAALFVFLSEALIVSYENAVPGYAVLDGTYLVVDFVCALGLFIVLMHYRFIEGIERAAALIGALLFLCCLLEAIRQMEVASGLTCWWGVRIADYCQLLTVGGASVGRGKYNHRPHHLMHIGRSDVLPDPSGIRRDGR